MNETFCGVCRHPVPGHELGCPVYTQEPQRGVLNQIQQAQGSLCQMGQAMPCPYCGGVGTHFWAGSGICPGATNVWPGYQPSAYGISETEERILAELSSLRQELRAMREQIDRLRREREND